MKPNFKDINIKSGSCCKADGKAWATEKGIGKDWMTSEQIPVKRAYTAEDLEGMEHLNYAAGLAPYLRGPYSVIV